MRYNAALMLASQKRAKKSTADFQTDTLPVRAAKSVKFDSRRELKSQVATSLWPRAGSLSKRYCSAFSSVAAIASFESGLSSDTDFAELKRLKELRR